MKDELIKKSIDASVAAKTNDLTNSLEYAVECIEGMLQAMRHELFVKCPRTAATTLKQLSETAARHAATASAHEAQFTALMRIQEVANAEYTGEEKA